MVSAPRRPRLEGREDHTRASYRDILEPRKEGGDGCPQVKGPTKALELGLSCLLPASQRKRRRAQGWKRVWGLQSCPGRALLGPELAPSPRQAQVHVLTSVTSQTFFFFNFRACSQLGDDPSDLEGRGQGLEESPGESNTLLTEEVAWDLAAEIRTLALTEQR